ARAGAAAVADTGRRGAPWWAPLASAVLPGSGQAAMRQTRAAGYLALEAYTWLQYAESKRDARRQRDEYRRIAASTARQPCRAPCPVGDWDYYERLENPDFIGSGRFDAVPGGAVDPETADSTYNGYIWALARDLYMGGLDKPAADPDYQRALAYYQQRAYPDAFAWSWRNGQAQLAEYRLAIARRNSSDRAAGNALSVVIANRVLSLVDAFVTVRARRLGPGGPAEFSATVPWARVPGLARPRR
ncbi:hypothetical protein, partial [Roseisolibacter sp. H3M3-2]|uniref:hypothetical protein n=1 Tax=Roseisolibacter sp. H3M3-2 TaxID=3031323 RepID=UPI0023D99427